MAVVISVEGYEALLEIMADLENRLSVHESELAEPDLRVPVGRVKAELGLHD